MQETAEKKQFDCIVVGGGAFGLAAISAMADLGITKSILLEKKKQLGSALQKSGESILLSGKSMPSKPLSEGKCSPSLTGKKKTIPTK